MEPLELNNLIQDNIRMKLEIPMLKKLHGDERYKRELGEHLNTQLKYELELAQNQLSTVRKSLLGIKNASSDRITKLVPLNRMHTIQRLTP